MHTDPTALLGSVDVCAALGIDRSTLSRWVAAGTAIPAHKLPGRTGSFLFTPAELDRLKASKGISHAH
jgi:hypothetical protein